MATTGVDPYRSPYAQAQGLAVDPFGADPNATNTQTDQINPGKPGSWNGGITMSDLLTAYARSQGFDPNDYSASYGTGNEQGAPLHSRSDALATIHNALATIAATRGGTRAEKRSTLLAQLNSQGQVQTQQRAAQQAQQQLSGAAQGGIDLRPIVGDLNAAGKSKKGSGQANAAGVQQWFNDYVTPYIVDQQARLSQAADLYEQTMNEIVPYLNPARQQIALNYMPLIVAAYRQKAAQFPTQFLTGNSAGSMIGMLLQNSKRNSTILNYLNQQTQTPSNISGGGGGGNGNFAALLQQAGVPTGG